MTRSPNSRNQGLDACISLLNRHAPLELASHDTLFVAGCGDGSEAIYLSQYFKCKVVGVDLRIKTPHSFDHVSIRHGDLNILQDLPTSCRMIFSFHVIEHVTNPTKVLSNLRSILADDGIILIGFPNKLRLLGYIDSKASLKEKIRWNLKDLYDRLTFRFENELGAHAGFAHHQFKLIAQPLFKECIPVTKEYIYSKYKDFGPLASFICSTGLYKFLFPSCYFILRK